MRRPLVRMALVFCLGIAVAVDLKIPFFIFYFFTFLCLVFSIIFLKQNTKFNIFILCAALFLGATVLRNSQILPNCHIAKLVPYKSESTFLIGVIDNDPIYQNRSVSFILKVEEFKINETWHQTCGKVLVKVFKKNNFTYGDRLFLSGKLYRPLSFSKGKFNYRDYLKHQGIYSILSVKKDSRVKELKRDAGNRLKSLSFRIKHRLREVIIKNLSFLSAGILNALILGDRQDLPAYLLDILMNLGTIHILARQYTKIFTFAL